MNVGVNDVRVELNLVNRRNDGRNLEKLSEELNRYVRDSNRLELVWVLFEDFFHRFPCVEPVPLLVWRVVGMGGGWPVHQPYRVCKSGLHIRSKMAHLKPHIDRGMGSRVAGANTRVLRVVCGGRYC